MISKIEQKGYAAFDKVSGKALCNYWSGGSQTGTNKQCLVTDPERVSINSEENIKIYIEWYNRSHKNQIEFEIKKVKKTSLCEVEIKE